MTIISGILKDRQGTVLAQASLTLTETDSKQTVITTTDNTGHYYIQLSPGTWRVTLGRGDAPPKDAGVIAITKDTAPGALDDYIASLQPSTLDIQVLGFMRGLVDEAERASEATSQAKQFADAARQGAQQAEQALKAAQEIAKTPGPKGDKGDPGPQGIPGRGGYQGKDGKSAYDVWALQQPAGSDTSVTAFMAYLKAIPGPKGDKGGPGKDGAPGKSAYEIWVAQQPAGSDTSMAAYLEFQKGKAGPPGEPGAPGEQGKSAYEIWAEQQPDPAYATLDDFMNMLNGGGINVDGSGYNIRDYVIGYPPDDSQYGSVEGYNIQPLQPPGTWDRMGAVSIPASSEHALPHIIALFKRIK
ncbi:prophage tail fiber N-terminal domain-containing protein [Salmonella enterica]|nr:prophage tail fiber N-terminal domain-containing protein [Salmonella enterica]